MESDDMSGPHGVVSEPRHPVPWLHRGRIDEQDPIRDARVAWLIDEVCNRQALFHRYEDVRRRDRGGKWDGSGYPLVQADDRMMERLSAYHDPADEHEDSLDAADSRHAWQGLVKLVEHQFGSHDDVPAIVRLLAEDADVQESFGNQWPIGKIARALNQRDGSGSWNDDRVENAKRRLTKWVVRVKTTHGLDAIDFRALLARYAREKETKLTRGD